MAFVEDSIRASIGIGANVAQASSIKQRREALDRLYARERSLIEPELESIIRKEVNDADCVKEMEIWTYLEIFNRDNPHLAGIGKWWYLVDGSRFIFSEDRLVRTTKKPHITKKQKEDLTFNKNVIIELIMNTYGAYSRKGAAFKLGNYSEMLT